MRDAVESSEDMVGNDRFLGNGYMNKFESAQRRLMNAAFSILYHRAAVIYDYFTRLVFAGEWQRWQAAAVAELPTDGLIVEVGSGTADFASNFCPKFDRWIAIEASREMMRFARSRTIPNNLELVRASACAMPLQTAVADAVVATFPSNYIFDFRFLSEAERVLRSDGKLVVVVTGDLEPIGWRRRLIRGLMRLSGGSASRSEATELSFSGFKGAATWRRTKFGAALVYVGQPAA